MNPDPSGLIREKAPLILAEIQNARSILLHCHPAPDPDSVGSALALKFALEQLGKNARVIKGDSEFPRGFMHFPGAKDIVMKKFAEINAAEFDLFIIADSARIEMVSRRDPVVFPKTMKTIAIDHHQSNGQYADINLVIPSYPANCLLLNDLFKEWGVKMTPEIASNLFIGAFSDTGGFKYSGVDAHTYEIAAELVKFIPSVSDLITKMEFSNTKQFVAYEAAALNSIEEFCGGVFALSTVPYSFILENKIPLIDVRTSEASSFMLTVAEWKFVAAAVEIEPHKVKFSFRSKDIEKYDVAVLTNSLGGGGHRAAAGLVLDMPLEEAKKLVVAKAKELYKL